MLRAASQMFKRNFSTLSYQTLHNHYKKMEFGRVVDEVNKRGATNQPEDIKNLYFKSMKVIEEQGKINNEIQNTVDCISLKYKISSKEAYEVLKQQAMKSTLNPKLPESAATQAGIKKA